MGRLIHVRRPLLEHALTVLRDKHTRTVEFRQHAAIVSQILLVEATRRLAELPHAVETPLGPHFGDRFFGT